MADGLDDSQVCRLIIERQLVTPEEVRVASDQRKQLVATGHDRPITEILVDLGFLTRTQLQRLHGSNEDSGGRPAQQLPGYQILNKCGAGAMAVVYRAKQLSLDRTVAVKVLPKRLSKNAEFVERFYREGRAAAQLNHPNIVQAIDVAEANSYHYFVMEFVEGCTVYDELAEGKVYSEHEAIEIITQITRALLHAHERGFIHRDVKPKNIILTPKGVAKLTDLGLARAMDDKGAAESEAGKAYGTPYYISPEQIRGEVDIDFRSDIYSLGATLYHLVTGRTPFEAETPTAVMHKHLKEPLIPPDHINTALSAGISEIVEVAMAKRREDRYASTKDMLEDLEAVRRGEAPIHARRDVNIDTLATIEETGKTVDLTPGESQREFWNNSTFIVWVLAALAVSVLINVILLLVEFRK